MGTRTTPFGLCRCGLWTQIQTMRTAACNLTMAKLGLLMSQMGGIDEAALDRLSLVTEMTRHIKVRSGASGKVCVRDGRFNGRLGQQITTRQSGSVP